MNFINTQLHRLIKLKINRNIIRILRLSPSPSRAMCSFHRAWQENYERSWWWWWKKKKQELLTVVNCRHKLYRPGHVCWSHSLMRRVKYILISAKRLAHVRGCWDPSFPTDRRKKGRKKSRNLGQSNALQFRNLFVWVMGLSFSSAVDQSFVFMMPKNNARKFKLLSKVLLNVFHSAHKMLLFVPQLLLYRNINV